MRDKLTAKGPLRTLILKLAAAARDRKGLPPELAREVQGAVEPSQRGRPRRIDSWPPEREASAALLRLLLTRNGWRRGAANIDAGKALALTPESIGKYAKRRERWAELALDAWQVGAIDLVYPDEEEAAIRRAMGSVLAAFDKLPKKPGE